MTQRISRINNFCTVFGAGLFLFLAIGAPAILIESIFHGNSPLLLFVRVIFTSGWVICFRTIVKSSQAKDHPVIRLVLTVFSIVGGVALFGAISIILCVLGSWAIQAMT